MYYKYPPVYYYPNISFSEITENTTTIQPYVKQESSAIIDVIHIYSIIFVVMMMNIILNTL
jgi:hypothetical protein